MAGIRCGESRRFIMQIASKAKKAGRGFTLIELLVVTGIIAILTSILLPIISKVRTQARDAACLSNLKQLGAAFQAYAGQNDGIWPSPAQTGKPLWWRCSTRPPKNAS